MRRRRDRQPFTLRPAMAVAAALVLLFAGALAASYQYRTVRSEHRRQLAVQANILAASVTAAIAFDDRVAAQEYVNALKLDPRLDAVAVYDEMHHRVAGFQRAGSPAITDVLAAGGRLPPGGRLVEVPARQNGTLVGSVYLRAAPMPLVAQVSRFSGVVLLTLMAVLMLSLLAVAQRALARAHAALQRRAQQLAEANARLSEEIAQRARTEDALRQSQKMEAIGQLSGGIAHDFNNLLMIIRGSLGRLQKKLLQQPSAAPPPVPVVLADTAGGASRPSADPDEAWRQQVTRYLDMAQDAIDRGASLVERLLRFARRQPLAPKPLHLDRLIHGIRPLLDHSAGADTHIEYRLDSRWTVLCDANQMENALLNLVINARDAMPGGGRVTLATADLRVDPAQPRDGLQDGDYVHLQVADTGSGMDEAVRRKAFDPFFTTKPVGQGTGLGLSTILGYVESSHGVVHIDSVPGRGTTVHIILPRAADTSSPEES